MNVFQVYGTLIILIVAGSAALYLDYQVALYVLFALLAAICAFRYRQVERRLELTKKQNAVLLEGGDVGICILDEELRCVFMNEVARSLLGFVEGEFEGTMVLDTLLTSQENTSPKVLEAIDLALKDDEPKDIDARVRCRKDGAGVAVQSRVHPFVSDEGRKAVILFLRKIDYSGKSSQLEAEEPEEQGDQQTVWAESAGKERAEAVAEVSAIPRFITGMSHDLRTPLNSILGFAQILEQSEKAKGQEAEGSKILRSGRHLLRLITDIIDYAKIEAGQLSLKLEPVNFPVLLQEVADILSIQTEQRDLQLLVNLPEDVHSRWVLADHSKLRQAIAALTVQLVSWCQPGNRVELSFIQQGNGPIAVQLADRSNGLPVHRILPFFQDNPGADEGQGRMHELELEVVIAKKLIEEMGGVVQLEQLDALGIAFSIAMPHCQPATTSSDMFLQNYEQSDSSQFKEEAVQNDANYVLLYVEDDNANRQLVRSILKKNSNYTLIEAESGEEGIASAGQHLPDCILMDMHLPGMAGIEVMQQLKQDETTRHIPIIAVSGDVDAIEIENEGETGFIDYIRKPLNVAEFRKTINRVLQQLDQKK